MIGFISRRVLQLIEVLFVVSIVGFTIVRLIPGDQARVILGDNFTQESYDQLRAALGLDKSLAEGYVSWISGALRGDFGYSFSLHHDVLPIVLQYLVPTLWLALFSAFLALAVAIPLGIAAGQRQGGPADVTLNVLAMAGVSVPGFIISLLLVRIFAVELKILPVAGFVSPADDLLEAVSHLLLPAVALAVVQIAGIGRVTRAAVVDVASSDFVRTARSKGAGPARVTLVHVLRAVGVPILTVVAQSFGSLVGGAAVIETIFSIPGVGQLMLSSIQHRDIPVIQGTILVVATIYVVLYALVDIGYSAIDPRIRITGQQSKKARNQ